MLTGKRTPGRLSAGPRTTCWEERKVKNRGAGLHPLSVAEFDLLLACLGERPDQILSLLPEVRWENVLRAASFHAILPRLARACLAYGEKLPASVCQQLRQCQWDHAKKCAMLLTDTVEIHSALAGRSLPGLFFKGLLLSAQVYGDPLARQCGDIDLLVLPRHVEEVLVLLGSRGYRPLIPLPPVVLREFVRANHELPLVRPDRGCKLDLHWALNPRYLPGPRTEDLWARSHRFTLGGTIVPVLAPVDGLLALCAHGCKSGWSGLRWVEDVYRFLKTYPDLDWEEVLSTAAVQRQRGMLASGMARANFLQGGALDSKIVQAWRGCQKLDLGAPNFRSVLRCLESWRDQLTYVRGRLFTPTLTDYARVALPPSCFPLYTLLRLASAFGLG